MVYLSKGGPMPIRTKSGSAPAQCERLQQNQTELDIQKPNGVTFFNLLTFVNFDVFPGVLIYILRNCYGKKK